MIFYLHQNQHKRARVSLFGKTTCIGLVFDMHRLLNSLWFRKDCSPSSETCSVRQTICLSTKKSIRGFFSLLIQFYLDAPNAR